jgi:peptide/nickel transport system substrate-binding protein
MYPHQITGFKYKRLLTIIVWFTLVSCGNKHKEHIANTIRLNYSSGTLESMDPAFAKDLYAMWTDHMLYNTLVETDENLKIVPSLAKTWEVSDDGLIYTFHLRADVSFQNVSEFHGRKMTAHDVVYSFNRIISPEVASSGAWIFNDKVIKDNPFVAVDDSTLTIHLIKPFRPLPQILSMPYCSIVPHEVVEKWGKDFRAHPCGTGPFQFHYWDEGNTLVLKKNPHYWQHDETGKQMPYADAVQIGFVDSKATEFMLLLQGNLDFVNSIDGSFKDLVLTKKGELKKEFENKIQLSKRTYLNTEYIGFLTDTANPVMSGQAQCDYLVRRAINYAIDRNKMVTYFKNGAVLPASSGFIPAGIAGHDDAGSFGYHYDVAKALELLKQAGHPNGKGLKPLHILTPPTWEDAVNFIATQLQEIGITLEVEVIQPNIMRQQVSKSQALMFRNQWIGDYPDAETFLAFFYSKYPAPPNYTRFNNATFDKWYEESMNLPDSQRFIKYRQMDSLVTYYAPVIPLFYDRMLHFTNTRISGFTSTPMNLIDLKRVKINVQ